MNMNKSAFKTGSNCERSFKNAKVSILFVSNFLVRLKLVLSSRKRKGVNLYPNGERPENQKIFFLHQVLPRKHSLSFGTTCMD